MHHIEHLIKRGTFKISIEKLEHVEQDGCPFDLAIDETPNFASQDTVADKISPFEETKIAEIQSPECDEEPEDPFILMERRINGFLLGHGIKPLMLDDYIWQDQQCPSKIKKNVSLASILSQKSSVSHNSSTSETPILAKVSLIIPKRKNSGLLERRMLGLHPVQPTLTDPNAPVVT